MAHPTQPLPVVLTPTERAALEHLARCGTEEARRVERARIVLGAAEGLPNRRLAGRLGVTRKVVATWRQRYVDRRAAAPTAAVRDLLADAPRPGAPDRIAPEQWVDLLALTTAAPASVGVPITHWTQRDLARVAVERGLVARVDPRSIGRFLQRTALQRKHPV